MNFTGPGIPSRAPAGEDDHTVIPLREEDVFSALYFQDDEPDVHPDLVAAPEDQDHASVSLWALLFDGSDFEESELEALNAEIFESGSEHVNNNMGIEVVESQRNTSLNNIEPLGTAQSSHHVSLNDVKSPVGSAHTHSFDVSSVTVKPSQSGINVNSENLASEGVNFVPSNVSNVCGASIAGHSNNSTTGENTQIKGSSVHEGEIWAELDTAFHLAHQRPTTRNDPLPLAYPRPRSGPLVHAPIQPPSISAFHGQTALPNSPRFGNIYSNRRRDDPNYTLPKEKHPAHTEHMAKAYNVDEVPREVIRVPRQFGGNGGPAFRSSIPDFEEHSNQAVSKPQGIPIANPTVHNTVHLGLNPLTNEPLERGSQEAKRKRAETDENGSPLGIPRKRRNPRGKQTKRLSNAKNPVPSSSSLSNADSMLAETVAVNSLQADDFVNRFFELTPNSTDSARKKQQYICKYRFPTLGEECGKIITSHPKPNRARHLCKHAKDEEKLIKDGEIDMARAVLLPLVEGRL